MNAARKLPQGLIPSLWRFSCLVIELKVEEENKGQLELLKSPPFNNRTPYRLPPAQVTLNLLIIFSPTRGKENFSHSDCLA